MMDEFTEFQMAVGQLKPSSSRGNGNNLGQGLWVLDHSPVHTTANHHYQNQKSESRNLTVQPFTPACKNPLSPPSSHHPEKNSVGSRLANYNLGMKGSTSGTIGQTLPAISAGSHLKQNIPMGVSINNNSSSHSLLIGEEDKYAALRSLVDFNTESPQMSSSSFGITENSESWQIKSSEPVMQTTIPDALKPQKPWPEDDFSSDFGDFQSFTGTHGGTQHNFDQQTVDTFLSISQNSTGNFSETTETKATNEPLRFGLRNNTTNNKCNDKIEMEFGDFVSVNPPPQSLNFVTQKYSIATSYNPVSEVPSNFDSINSTKNRTLDSLDLFSMPSHEISKPINDEMPAKTNGDFHPANSNFSANDFIGSSSVEMFSRPNFIKTSLIGYSTGIGDINDAAKCASPHESNNESLDFLSLGQKESFNSLDKNRFLDISPETRSIASLDLGSYCTVPEGSENVKSSPEQFALQNTEDIDVCSDVNTSSFAPVIHRESMDMRVTEILPVGNFSDKYQCFKEEFESDKESYNLEWIRCLECCKEIMSRTIRVFNEAPNSAVVREVVSDERGCSFTQNLLEIYFVSTRVHDSWNRIDGNSNVGMVGILYKDIQDLWENLTPFFIGTSASDIITLEQNRRDKSVINGYKFCGVCMNDVDEELYDVIDYGGKFYHSTCANFWINAVDTILPSLSHIPLSRNAKVPH